MIANHAPSDGSSPVRLAPSDARESTCPACGSHVAVAFFDGGEQPLASVGWPRSRGEAASMERLPLDYVCCVGCGHVYNARFDYANVPYHAQPNRMFNAGALWSGYLTGLVEGFAGELRPGAVVVEIGHGDASFLAAIAARRPDLRCVGFDPHGSCASTEAVELRAELFVPERDLAGLAPDLLLSRHVFEHLPSPLALLQRIAFCASALGREQSVFVEVPCLDRAVAACRTVDFFYEHYSQFTTTSLRTMFERAGARGVSVGHGSNGEVVFARARLGTPATARTARDALAFARRAADNAARVRARLDELHATGARVVIWGGTGRSAAFIDRYGLDADRFPTVVDSDVAKAGTYVPGTGQVIRVPEALEGAPADVVIVPSQWRAKDIFLEMQRRGSTASAVLIEHDGDLVDYASDPHPYH